MWFPGTSFKRMMLAQTYNDPWLNKIVLFMNYINSKIRFYPPSIKSMLLRH